MYSANTTPVEGLPQSNQYVEAASNPNRSSNLLMQPEVGNLVDRIYQASTVHNEIGSQGSNDSHTFGHDATA